MAYCGFTSYHEMVSAAMLSEDAAQPWYNWLKLKKARHEAEADVLKEFRKKHPGLADYEILQKASKWLDKNFPVPTFN